MSVKDLKKFSNLFNEVVSTASSTEFGYHAKSTAGAATAAANITPQKTMMASLTNKSFAVKTTAASGTATANLHAVGQNLKGVKADISNTIRQAQKEVAAATKAMGENPGTVFPDNRMASGGTGEFLVNMASDAAIGHFGGAGMGSLVTQGQSASFIAGDLSKTKGSSKSEIMAKLQETLIQSSSAPQKDTRAFMPGQQAPQKPDASRLNWQAFSEQGHKLEDLMSLDPENPNPAFVPEFEEIANTEISLNKEIDNRKVAEINADNMGGFGDEAPVSAGVENYLEDVDATLFIVSASLSGVDKLNTNTSFSTAGTKADLAPPAPAQNIEFDPTKLPPLKAFNMQSGNMA